MSIFVRAGAERFSASMEAVLGLYWHVNYAILDCNSILEDKEFDVYLYIHIQAAFHLLDLLKPSAILPIA